MNKNMNNTKINLKYTNLSVSDETKNKVDQKIQSITKFLKLSDDMEALFDIELGKLFTNQNSGDIFRTEINLEYNGKFFRSEATKSNLYEALDDAVVEMVAIVRKNKEKRFSLIRKGASKIKDLFRKS